MSRALKPWSLTDQMYVGLRGGRCVAIAWKLDGKDGAKENARTVAEWTRDGLDVLTIHKSESDAYYEQMRQGVISAENRQPRLIS